MPAHIHAALMAEYAKDALETDKPWERWEKRHQGCDWTNLQGHPGWSYDREYRHKRIPLCQVKGRDVFPGDKLWHVEQGWMTAIKTDGGNLVCTTEDGNTWRPSLSYLSWTAPAKTKTVYQWAFEQYDGRFCATSYFYSTEDEAHNRTTHPGNLKVIRLDWTALEVPA